jgi:hypothetical protein
MTNHKNYTLWGVLAVVFSAFMTAFILLIQCTNDKKKCLTDKNQCITDKNQCITDKNHCQITNTQSKDQTKKTIPGDLLLGSGRMKGYARRSFATGTGCPCDGRGCTDCKEGGKCVICQIDEKTGKYIDNDVACTSKFGECTPLVKDADDYYYGFRCGVCKNLEKNLPKNADQYADFGCEASKYICKDLQPNAERYTELGCSKNVTAVCADNNLTKVDCPLSIIEKQVYKYTKSYNRPPSDEMLKDFKTYASRFQWVNGQGCKAVCGPGQIYTQTKYKDGKYVAGSGGCRILGQTDDNTNSYKKLIEEYARKNELRDKQLSDRALESLKKAMESMADAAKKLDNADAAKKPGTTLSAFRGPLKR